MTDDDLLRAYDDDLVRRVEERRDDPEFMERLCRLFEDNRDVLERLAPHDHEEER